MHNFLTKCPQFKNNQNMDYLLFSWRYKMTVDDSVMLCGEWDSTDTLLFVPYHKILKFVFFLTMLWYPFEVLFSI